MRKFSFLLTLFLAMSVIGVYAQPSKGGIPPSFSQTYQFDESRAFTVPEPNVAALQAEDALRTNPAPRLAVALPVDLSPCNSGEWITLDSGETVWQLAIESPGAKALLLTYSSFNLPKGSKLFIYNRERTQVLGAYTEENNPKFGPEFSTEMVNGDFIILEYVPPIVASNLQKIDQRSGAIEVRKAPRPDYPDIQIESVGYIYNDLSPMTEMFNLSRTPSDLGTSGSCQVNVNCANGAQWQNEKKGVAATLQRIGNAWYICTGSLINNLREDLTPYFLMAWHCSEDEGVRPTAAQYNQWQFYFHWERTGCANTTPLETYQTITGCQWVAESSIYGGSDGLLLKFNTAVPPGYDLFYNGWEATSVATGSITTTTVGIHHPSGDIKKVSLASGNTTSATWSGGASNGHWSNSFNPTATEGGSSGSPLFNQDKRIIGTLTGGNSSCSYAQGVNQYGKMGYHLDKFTAEPVMQPFLDPDGTGVRVCDGRYTGTNPIVNFTATTQNPYAMQPVQFYSQSFYATDFLWTFPGGTPSTSTEENPIVTYAVPGGPHDVTLAINGGTLIKHEPGYINCTEKLNEELLEIGTGTGTANPPIGWANNNARTHTATLYTAAQLGGEACEFHSIAWRTNTARTTSRTIRVWMEHTTDTDVTGVAAWQINDPPNGTATLVAEYTGQSNVAGWNTWTFNRNGNKFDFNGTDNVIIYVEAFGSGNSNTSTATRYTTSGTNTNRTWTSNNTSQPTGTATTNNQKPNIQLLKKSASTIPVANFGGPIRVFPEMEENFDEVDEDTFPPVGWTKADVSGTVNHWEWDSPGFEGSPGCAFRGYTASGTQNSWLITDAIVISATGYMLEFQSLIGYLSYYGSGRSRVHVSTTDNQVSSFVLLKEFLAAELTEEWTKWSFSLDAYAGQTIYIGFQYTGTDTHDWWIDDVVVGLADPLGTLQIYRDQTLVLEDLSTGPPVVWDWQLPGSNTPTIQSFGDAPETTYAYSGIYDIGLTVTNLKGSDTKYVPERLIVRDRAPKINFGSKGGYDAMGDNIYDFHTFITPGTSVRYIDKTEWLPDTYNWTFDGGRPNLSTLKDPIILYNNEGDYSTSLTVKNSAGGATLEKEDLILVGYGPENITNWDFPGTSGGFYTFGTNLYVFGSNNPNSSNNGWTQIAERFDGPVATAQIDNILTLIGYKGTGSRDYTLAILLPGPNGPDGTELYSQTFNIDALPDIPSGGLYYDFPINPPVIIPEGQEFWVRISGFVAHANATRLVFAGSMGDPVESGEVSTCWVYQFISNSSSVWTALSDIFVGEPESSIAWWPELKYIQLDVDPLLTLPAEAGTKIVPVVSNGTYSVATTETWFTVAVDPLGVEVVYDPNVGTPRQGTFTVTGAGGVTRIVDVLQAFEPLALTITPDTQTIPFGAATVSFNILSNIQWTVTNEDLWVDINNPSGMDNTTFTFDVTENLSLENRTAELTIYGGELTQTFTLIQEGKGLYLEIDPTGTINVDKMNGNRFIAVSTNSSWYAVADVSWISFTEQYGEGDGTIYFNFNANPTNVARTAIITVTAAALTETLIVVQAAGTSTFIIDPNTLQLSATASTATVQITSPLAWNSNIPNDGTWYSLSSVSGTGNETITITYSANTTNIARTSEILFNDGIVYRSLQLNQPGSAEITLLPVTHGSVAVFDGATPVPTGTYVDLGTIITVVATPDPGYALESLLINGLPYANNATYFVTGTTTVGADFEAGTFTLTFDPTPGTVDITSKEVTFDDVIGELPVPERTDYDFAGWFIGSTEIFATTVWSYTTDQTADAAWTLNQFEVTYATPTNGTLTVMDGSTPVPSGTFVDLGTVLTITAVPDANYHISYLAVNTVPISSGDTWTVVATTDIACTFTMDGQFGLTLLSVPTGIGILTGAGDYFEFDIVPIDAVPINANWEFDEWLDGQTVISTVPSFNFVMPDEAKTLTATFLGVEMLIEATANPTEGGTVTGDGLYRYNTTATLIATPEEHFTFENWTEGGVVVAGAGATYSFTVETPRELVANFVEDDKFALTIAADPVAGGTPSGAGNYYAGEEVSLNTTVNTNYNFTGWFDGTTLLSATQAYDYTMPASDKIIMARYALDQYEVIYETPANGTLTVTEGTTPVPSGTFVDYGTVLTITAIPAVNYHFGTLTVNGTPFTSGSTHTVDATTTIVCTFVEDDKYVLTLVADPTAGGTPSGAGSYYAGEEVPISTTLNENYSFTGWYDGETVLATTPSYSYTMPAVAKTLTAKYALVQYQVTYNTPSDGTLTVVAGTTPIASGTVVDYGTVITITATPDEDFDIDILTVNDEPFASGDNYTIVSETVIECSFKYVGINSKQFTGFNLYPNPAKDVVTVVSTTKDNANIEIFNGIGSLVQTVEMNDTKLVIDVSSFASGIYTIRLTNERGSTTLKFVKE